jgi:outer membrane receptor for ferrienterochelin and colicins
VQQVEVRGAAEAYDPRRDDTASKIVVNHDEIVKYGDTSVLDVLKRVPGVTVSGSGGRGARSACAAWAAATPRS